MNHKKDFHELFIVELRDMFSGEKQILKALPSMIKEAHSPDLKEALQKHFCETTEQLKRLEIIGIELGVDLNGSPCGAMQGIMKEIQDVFRAKYSPAVRDVALISYAQRIEHYEIAVYGALVSFAKHLKLSDIKKALEQTLEEEQLADKKLNELAEGTFFTSGLNRKAEKVAS